MREGEKLTVLMRINRGEALKRMKIGELGDGRGRHTKDYFEDSFNVGTVVICDQYVWL